MWRAPTNVTEFRPHYAVFPLLARLHFWGVIVLFTQHIERVRIILRAASLRPSAMSHARARKLCGIMLFQFVRARIARELPQMLLLPIAAAAAAAAANACRGNNSIASASRAQHLTLSVVGVVVVHGAFGVRIRVQITHNKRAQWASKCAQVLCIYYTLYIILRRFTFECCAQEKHLHTRRRIVLRARSLRRRWLACRFIGRLIYAARSRVRAFACVHTTLLCCVRYCCGRSSSGCVGGGVGGCTHAAAAASSFGRGTSARRGVGANLANDLFCHGYLAYKTVQ